MLMSICTDSLDNNNAVFDEKIQVRHTNRARATCPDIELAWVDPNSGTDANGGSLQIESLSPNLEHICYSVARAVAFGTVTSNSLSKAHLLGSTSLNALTIGNIRACRFRISSGVRTIDSRQFRYAWISLG